jgi:hypothetical protein
MSRSNNKPDSKDISAIQSHVNAVNQKSYNPKSASYENTVKFDGLHKGGNFAHLTQTNWLIHLAALPIGGSGYLLEGTDPEFIKTLQQIEADKPTEESITLARVAALRKKAIAEQVVKWKDLQTEVGDKKDWLYYIINETVKMNRREIDQTKLVDTTASVFTSSTDSFGHKTKDPGSVEYQEEQFDKEVIQMRQMFPNYNFQVCEKGETAVPLSFDQKKMIAKVWQETQAMAEYPQLFAEPPKLTDADDIAYVKEKFKKQLADYVALKNDNESKATKIRGIILRHYAANVLEPHKERLARNEFRTIITMVRELYATDAETSVRQLNDCIAAFKFTHNMSYERFKEELKFLLTQLIIAEIAVKEGTTFDPIRHTEIANKINWDLSTADIRTLGYQQYDHVPSPHKVQIMLLILRKKDSDCTRHFDDVIYDFVNNINWQKKQSFTNLMILLDFKQRNHPKPFTAGSKSDHPAPPKKKDPPTQKECDEGKGCDHCGKWGHCNTECFVLHPELKQTKKTRSNAASTHQKKEEPKQEQTKYVKEKEVILETDRRHYKNVTGKMPPGACVDCWNSTDGSRKFFAKNHGPGHPTNKNCGHNKEVQAQRDASRKRKREEEDTTETSIPLNDQGKTNYPNKSNVVTQQPWRPIGTAKPDARAVAREKANKILLSAHVKSVLRDRFAAANPNLDKKTRMELWQEYWLDISESVQNEFDGDFACLLKPTDPPFVPDPDDSTQHDPTISYEEQMHGLQPMTFGNVSMSTDGPPGYTEAFVGRTLNLKDLMATLNDADPDDSPDTTLITTPVTLDPAQGSPFAKKPEGQEDSRMDTFNSEDHKTD